MQRHFGESIDVKWNSFLLRTEPKTADREKFVAYTQGWSRMAEMEPRAHFTPWSTTDDPPSSSLPAQVAHKVVESHWGDYAKAHHDRLLGAYFTENRTISDWGVLADIASEIGIDRSEFESVLNEQRQPLTAAVVDEHNAAIGQGITAVPTVVINDVLPVPGAQDSATYIDWIERMQERLAEQTRADQV